MKPIIHIKRIYEPPAKSDGYRILVDRLWPRGIKKDDAQINVWLKEIAPSDKLRKWFNHDPEKFGEFEKRYIKELKVHHPQLKQIAQRASKEKVTLLYSARDEAHNQAVVLQKVLMNYL